VASSRIWLPVVRIFLDSGKVFANLTPDFDGEMAEWLKALVC
jgi:hypothetical protein